jgi:protoporphyrinogen oxidase
LLKKEVYNMRIAIIGTGISGLSAARLLSNNHIVTLFEKTNNIGGLIRCSKEEGHLYHRVGGHVFNSKNKEVLHWFWQFFNCEEEFNETKRNAKIWIKGKVVGYPIENYLYEFEESLSSQIVEELLDTHNNKGGSVNFKDFLISNFGKTLYELYFKPYNEKLWQQNTANMPLDWLEGKLPMPDIKDIIMANIHRTNEEKMVHSCFFYPKENGSQFIIDRLAKDLFIQVDKKVTSLVKSDDRWLINEREEFDSVIYTGDIRRLSELVEFSNELDFDTSLFRSNGTSNCLCETDSTDLSWLYIPDKEFKAHRIIYTGNFSDFNNAKAKRKSCVVEFSGKVDEAIMKEEIKKLPGNLNFIRSNYEANSYVIQSPQTRKVIQKIKEEYEPQGLYLLGRFAEWEYYNMDKCIESAMRVADKIKK